MRPDESCECQVCRVIRDTFNVPAGEEVECIGKLVEAVEAFAGGLNAIDGVLEKTHQHLREQRLERDKIQPQPAFRRREHLVERARRLQNEEENDAVS